MVAKAAKKIYDVLSRLGKQTVEHADDVSRNARTFGSSGTRTSAQFSHGLGEGAESGLHGASSAGRSGTGIPVVDETLGVEAGAGASAAEGVFGRLLNAGSLVAEGSAKLFNKHPVAVTAGGLLGLPLGWNLYVRDKSLVQAVSDFTLGDGVYDKTKEVIGTGVDGTVELASDVKQGVYYLAGKGKQGVEASQEAAGKIHDQLSNMMANFDARQAAQQQVDQQQRAMQAAYAQMAAQQGYYPESYPMGDMSQSQQPGFLGSMKGMGNSFMNLLNNFTGGGSNNLSLLGLVLGAYMIFGGLGKGAISKVIGGLAAGMSFRSLVNGTQVPKPQQQTQQYQQLTPEQYQAMMRQNYERQMEQQRQQDQQTVVDANRNNLKVV